MSMCECRASRAAHHSRLSVLSGLQERKLSPGPFMHIICYKLEAVLSPQQSPPRPDSCSCVTQFSTRINFRATSPWLLSVFEEQRLDPNGSVLQRKAASLKGQTAEKEYWTSGISLWFSPEIQGKLTVCSVISSLFRA